MIEGSYWRRRRVDLLAAGSALELDSPTSETLAPSDSLLSAGAVAVRDDAVRDDAVRCGSLLDWHCREDEFATIEIDDGRGPRLAPRDSAAGAADSRTSAEAAATWLPSALGCGGKEMAGDGTILGSARLLLLC